MTILSSAGQGTPTYKAITAVHALTDMIDTAKLFQSSYAETGYSPVDWLIENTDRINKIFLQYMAPNSPPLPQELGTLVVLGYMSAVESYLRALVRGLINIDEYARRLVEGRPVSFAAALHHQAKLLPEALLEDASLAGPDNVVRALRELAGVKGQLPADVQHALGEYRKICEIRHCCVHRFGKLGTKNAIVLGLEDHKTMLEKPLNLSVDDLQMMAEVLRTFTKTMNNYVFRTVLERTARNRDDQGREKIYPRDWTWDYRSDRRRFERYYTLFATTLDARPSPSAKEVYDSFRLEFFPGARRARAPKRARRSRAQATVPSPTKP